MILRAGPFASPTNSFLEEPESPQHDILPVNCGLHYESQVWPWRLLRIGYDVGEGEATYETIAENEYLTDFFSAGGGGGGYAIFEGDGVFWRYQAANALTLSGSVAVNVEGRDEPGGGGSWCYFSVSVFAGGDYPGFQLYQEGSGSQSENFSIELPPAVIPAFVRMDFIGEATDILYAALLINL